MHEVLDTETSDSADEMFWPQDFKLYLRGPFREVVLGWLREQNVFHKIHEQKSPEDSDQFLERLADKIIIGAENGADDAFGLIHRSLPREAVFPSITEWVESISGREIFSDQVRKDIKKAITDEYSQEHLYEHIYEDFCQEDFPSFADFIRDVSACAVTGIINGVEGMLMKMMQAFIFDIPLPPARRYPKPIKAL
ncbi:hypothetical protein ACFL9T_03510 [Thermodesulfobacteriota bacterium]